MKRVLLFGGTFDPIHSGHLEIADKAMKFSSCSSCVFIPCRNPRWKEPLSDPKDRLNMLRIALKGKPKFKISLIEYNSKEEVNYTYDTIQKLGDFNQTEYFLLIGSDQLEKLHLWYRIEELSKMVHILVFKRANYPINEINLKKYNCILIKGESIDQSSSDIRFLRKLYLPKEILDYIAEHNLYYMRILRYYISEKRLRHSISVANLAYDIALHNSLDAYKAYLAGLLHDIAREIPEYDMFKAMEDYFPFYLSLPGFTYHQFVGTLYIQDILKIEDKEIIESVMYHCTGYKNMSSLGMIIYSADKIEPTRGYDSSSLIKACLKDYRNGFKEVLKANREYFESKSIEYLNPLTEGCLEAYLEE